MNFDDGILKEHNKQPYIKLMEEIAKSKKACAIHATGTGKMYLALKWLNDYKDEPFVYIAPTNVILNKFLNVIIKQYYPSEFKRLEYMEIDDKLDQVNQLLNNKNIHLLTYAKVNSLTSEEKKELHVKRIVLDEFHRCGADKWGEAIREFLDIHSDAEVLGLSATPIRPSDGRNMVEELFDGKQTSTITLEDAFKNGILPIPNLICAIYSFGEELDEIKRSFQNKTLSKETEQIVHDNLKKAKRLIEQARGIKEIFSAGLAKLDNPARAKFIVFCSSVEDMKQKMEEAKNWFDSDKKISIYSVNYTKGDIANTKTIATFEDDQSDSIKLLFSVDMLNEGLHVENIDGVIMLRPTESNIIFLQQLGRALATSDDSNKVPLIFDLVNNIEILDSDIRKFNEIVLNYHKKGDSNFTDNELINFEIQKDIIDIVKKLKEISLTYIDRFSPLVDYYNNHGTIANIQTKEEYFYNGKKIRIGNIIGMLRVQYAARSAPISNSRGGYIRPLTDGEVELLNKLGMQWKGIANFNERIAPLIDYYNKYGTIASIELRDTYVYNDKKINIGNIIRLLRNKYQARTTNNDSTPLTDEEVMILENMGMVWVADKKDFMVRIAPLIDYYHKHGTIANIKKNESYLYNDKEVKIGILVSELRKNYFAREAKNSSKFPLTDEEVKILEDMGMIWSAIKTFDERIAPLVDYYHRYGTIANISSKDTYVYNNETLNIGSLILNLRRAYLARENKDFKSRVRALTDEEVEVLEKMGMVWKANKTFKERIAPLLDYYQKNGTIANISNRDTYIYNGEEVNIGTLIANLRQNYLARLSKDYRYVALKDEEVKMLEDMGMVWSASRTFKERIAPLLDYYQKNGTIANISSKSTYMYEGKEVKIGVLILSLRGEYAARNNPKSTHDPLTDEEVKILENMGMIWSASRKNHNIRLAPLVDYYHKYGTLANIAKRDTYIYNGKEVKIGSLIGDLRREYYARNGNNPKNPLSDEEVELLEKMGMVWNVDKRDFMLRIAPLIDYYHKYGTLANIKKSETYLYNDKEVKIGVLVSDLRKNYFARDDESPSKRPLTNEEVKILEDMGMIWSAIKTFDERIAPLVDYYHKYGSLANINLKDTYIYNNEEVNIGTLISNLRKAYQARTNEDCKYLISDEQIKMLEDMGMVWSKPKGRQ